MFEQIESLKREYTDKYVVVDESRPELKRFHGMTGQVKTVNMSGRALVQFDGNLNIGWYDIDPVWLKMVDAPAPKPAEGEHKTEKPAAAKPKGAAPAPQAAAPAPKPAAPSKPAAAPTEGKKSTADILAAARGGAAPAAAKPAAAAPAAKKSTADILAAARGGAAAAKPAPAPAKPAAPASAAPQAAKPAPAKPAAPPPPPPAKEPEAPAAQAPAAASGKFNRDALPKAVPDILAWCREHDSK